MTLKVAKIGLIIRPGVPEALELAHRIAEHFSAENYQICIDRRSAEIPGLAFQSRTLDRDALVESCNPIVTLGGDGTLIGIARRVRKVSPVMIGVNFGTLGFLTEISPGEVFATIKNVLEGRCEVGSRAMLHCQVHKGLEVLNQGYAINDIVVQKGSRDKLLDLDLSINKQEVLRLRADGMIVSTPTGSTAYSLAAGGSIVHPQLAAVLVTPICSHSLNTRPFILPNDFELQISIPHYDGEVFLSLDGQESFDLIPGMTVSVQRAPFAVNFARSTSKTYFHILQSKLHWGIPNKNER